VLVLSNRPEAVALERARAHGIPAEARIACGQPPAGLGAANDDGQVNVPGTRPDGTSPDGEDPGDPDSPGDPSGEPPSGGPGPGDPRPGGSPPDGASPPPRLADLVLPLRTLLGLADRPGEGHGLGPLDPDLCRALAATAANSRHSTLCVTVTDPGGIAIGHGCARPARRNQPQADPAHGPPRAPAALPAQVNLTITAARLAELDWTGPPGVLGASVPPGQPPWSITRVSDSGPPGGSGTWLLSLPDGRQLTVALEPLPTYKCDHRHESHAYQPNDHLRHLVQVRDYTCTFPPCNRHAKESDFEHAVPYDKGGRTCSCNAGARSRACHQVKQSPGWKATQLRPGWHQWQTPSGRTYTQPPKHYPT